MNTLDEDQLNKITYQPDCQATFRKYEKDLKKEILNYNLSIVLGLILVLMLVLIMFFTGALIPPIVLIPFCLGVLFWLATTVYPISILKKDLAENKLDIRIDTFFKLSAMEAKKSNEYLAEFQKEGLISIPSKTIKNLVQNKDTEVYIIRTIYSKRILDIVPVYWVK